MKILIVNIYKIKKNSFNLYEIYAKKFTVKKYLHIYKNLHSL